MLKVNVVKHLSALIPLLSGIMFITPLVALADSITDWTLNVKTEQLQGQFQYKGAAIAPVAKTSVQMYPSDNEAQKQTYEYLWYHNGKPIGLERVASFGPIKGKSVSIRIVPKSQAGQEEEKAAADIILRLVLDCYRNSDGVLAITVPGRNYDGIEHGMTALGLVESSPADPDFEASKAKMTFTLQSDSDDRATHLFYE